MRIEQVLTPEQFRAVQEFADGLKGCYVQAKTKASNPELDYAISIIDVHLAIKKLDVERWDYEVEENRLTDDLEKKT